MCTVPPPNFLQTHRVEGGGPQEQDLTSQQEGRMRVRPSSRKEAGLDYDAEDSHPPPPRDEAEGGTTPRLRRASTSSPRRPQCPWQDQARLEFPGSGRPLQPDRGLVGGGRIFPEPDSPDDSGFSLPSSPVLSGRWPGQPLWFLRSSHFKDKRNAKCLAQGRRAG